MKAHADGNKQRSELRGSVGRASASSDTGQVNAAAKLKLASVFSSRHDRWAAHFDGFGSRDRPPARAFTFVEK